MTEKEKNKKIGGVKMRNGSGQQSENERQWKKKKDRTGTQATKLLVSTYDISYIRCVTRKFHVVVVQNNVKEMYKESVLQVQSCFFCKLDLFDLFLPFSLPTPFSIKRLYFFVWVDYKYIKRLVAILKILSATGTI